MDILKDALNSISLLIIAGSLFIGIVIEIVFILRKKTME